VACAGGGAKNTLAGRLRSGTSAVGVEHTYVAEAALRDDRLIIIERPLSSRESCIIEVYPSFGQALRGTHSGVGILETWDGDEVLHPRMMSSRPLVGSETEGTLDATLWSHCDDAWRSGFRQESLLPSTQRSS
jgi:hypothetical protein